MYTHITWDCGRSIDHSYYWDGRYGARGEPRGKKTKPTPEQVEYQNRINKSKKIHRILRANFTEDDWWITLTYQAGERKPMKGVKEDFGKLLDRLRVLYRRAGERAKYLYVIEIGRQGGIHIHMVLNDLTRGKVNRILRDEWTHGHAYYTNLRRETKELAEYMAKVPEQKENKSKREQCTKLGKEEYCYSHSRNLIIPEPRKSKYSHWTMRSVFKRLENILKQGVDEKGYRIDQSSIKTGCNPFTGKQYLHYTMEKAREGP